MGDGCEYGVMGDGVRSPGAGTAATYTCHNKTQIAVRDVLITGTVGPTCTGSCSIIREGKECWELGILQSSFSHLFSFFFLLSKPKLQPKQRWFYYLCDASCLVLLVPVIASSLVARRSSLVARRSSLVARRSSLVARRSLEFRKDKKDIIYHQYSSRLQYAHTRVYHDHEYVYTYQ
jgi:hypothetical protein